MHFFMSNWFFYFLGFIGTLAWKWQRYCYEGKGAGVPFWQSSRKWFEITSFESKVSWFATIAVVWIIGSIYIGEINLKPLLQDLGIQIPEIPVNRPTSLLIGVLAEFGAPAIAKKLLAKFNFGGTENDTK